MAALLIVCLLALTVYTEKSYTCYYSLDGKPVANNAGHEITIKIQHSFLDDELTCLIGGWYGYIEFPQQLLPENIERVNSKNYDIYSSICKEIKALYSICSKKATTDDDISLID